jgi:hypothetical protein
MKTLFAILILFVATPPCFAAQPAAPVRTIENIPGLPTAPLRRMVSVKFYKSLQHSPVEGWIAVRGTLVNTGITSAKIVHSELNGAYDSLALDLANKYWGISGGLNPELGSHLGYCPVMVHLLIYQIKDGKMALSYVYMDNPGGNQVLYYGHAWIAVLKNGKWTQIKAQQ